MGISKKKLQKRQNSFLFAVIAVAFLLVSILFLWQHLNQSSSKKDELGFEDISKQVIGNGTVQKRGFSYCFYLFKNIPGVKNASYNLNSNPIEISLVLKNSLNVENFIVSLKNVLQQIDAKIISWKSIESPEKKIKIFMIMNREDLLLRVGWKEKESSQVVAGVENRSSDYSSDPFVKQDRGTKRFSVIKPGSDSPKIAIVLDDAGGLGRAQWSFLRINAKITFAVMPDLANSLKFSKRAHSKGYEVILHAPMMPLAMSKEAIPNRIIKPRMAKATVFNMLDSFFRYVPQARGMNNHMGSLATSDSKLMGFVMSYLKKRGFFFFDSVTHASSVAYRSALNSGIRGYRRDVFLDNHHDYKYIENSLYRLAKLSVKKGFAIGIGHVTCLNTYRVLQANIPKIQKTGIEFVFLSGDNKK